MLSHVLEMAIQNIIPHGVTNEWSSKNSSQRVGKSIVDVVISLISEKRRVTISVIIQRIDDVNNKVEDEIINQQICVKHLISVLLTVVNKSGK